MKPHQPLKISEFIVKTCHFYDRERIIVTVIGLVDYVKSRRVICEVGYRKTQFSTILTALE